MIVNYVLRPSVHSVVTETKPKRDIWSKHSYNSDAFVTPIPDKLFRNKPPTTMVIHYSIILYGHIVFLFFFNYVFVYIL